MKNKRILIVSIVVLFSMFSQIALAQNGGKIAGTVVDDSSGEPLIGANVYIEGTTFGASTDVDGYFVMLNVPSGKHNVQCSYIGYSDYKITEVQVKTDLTTTLNFKLKSQQLVGETIVVVADPYVVRKDLTSSEDRVQAEEIEQLPVMELEDVVTMQAGVSKDQNGDIHIRGGRASEVAYMVNGISVTDDFGRGQSVEIETESIQELQVISGAFNAEYGNAMSGVVNVITKTGSDEFKGKLEVWSGDYLSNRDKIFFNIDDLNLTDNRNIQASISGPIFSKNLRFYATARKYYTDGWMYMVNAYNPKPEPKENDSDPMVPVKEDSSAVPGNFSERLSGQFSLEWNVDSKTRFKLDAFGSKEEIGFYGHGWRLNPNGRGKDREHGYTFIGNVNRLLWKNTFIDITTSYKRNEFEFYLYKDPHDPRYVDPQTIDVFANQYLKAGTNLGRFNRVSESKIGKMDFTSQVSRRHLIKSGIEYKSDEIYYDQIQLKPEYNEDGEFITVIDGKETLLHNQFTRTPYQVAAYIQDKIEYEDFILNIGVRFELFDPKGNLPIDTEDPNIYDPIKAINKYNDNDGDGIISQDEAVDANIKTVAQREKYWYKETSVKTQVSPRLGISYPITENGFIHFSYGIFQQIPDYALLYVGDQIKLASGASGVLGIYGNPDLKPEKSTKYEIGLQQQINDIYYFDITAFYEDKRNWISTGIPFTTPRGDLSYVKYRNRDFANVRGLTFKAGKRFSDHYSFDLDYTFQIVEGTNSSPDQEFQAAQGNSEPTRQLTALDWDQRHQLNFNSYISVKDVGLSILGRYNTGQPYSPFFIAASSTGQSVSSALTNNSRYKPARFEIDLSLKKEFKYKDFGIEVYAKVFNLLDADNPVNVFGDSGRADYTWYQDHTPEADETIYNIPTFYSEPRRFQIGTKISFK